MHAACANFFCICPAGQLLQWVSAAMAILLLPNFPGLHMVHPLVLPTLVLYWPTAHLRHESWPAHGCHWPLGQASQYERVMFPAGFTLFQYAVVNAARSVLFGSTPNPNLVEIDLKSEYTVHARLRCSFLPSESIWYPVAFAPRRILPAGHA